MLPAAGRLDSRVIRFGAWVLAISGVMPWFTSGPMSQPVLAGRGWIALLSGLVALWWSYRPPRRWVEATGSVIAVSAAVGLLTGVSGFVASPTALGPSIGVCLCGAGSVLVGLGIARSVRQERQAGDSSALSAVADDGSDPHSVPIAEPDDEHRAPTGHRVGRWAASAALVIVGVLVVFPARPGDLGTRAEPASTYDDAVERFDAVTADEAGTVFGPCESRLMSHGERAEVAVVFFHGLTNCPKQFVEFGTRLHDAGANVLILRAPGHGIANDDGSAIGGLANVAGLSAEKLRDYADEAIDIGAGLGDEVRVLGLSMGGVIATWVGQERSDVDRVVAVAPAMTIPRVPAFVTSLFRNITNKLPNIDLPGRSKLDHAYTGETTKGLNATFLMADYVARSAYDRGPAADEVVVVVNSDDDQVDPQHVEAFAERWIDHEGRVTIHRLPALGLPHDVIDPDQPAGDIEAVYPILTSLLDGTG